MLDGHLYIGTVDYREVPVHRLFTFTSPILKLVKARYVISLPKTVMTGFYTLQVLNSPWR